MVWKGSPLRQLLVVSSAALLVSAFCFFFLRRLKPGWTRVLCALPVLAAQVCLPFVFDQETQPVFLAVAFCIATWLGTFRVLALSLGRGLLTSAWCQHSFARFHLTLTVPLHLGPPMMTHPQAASPGLCPGLQGSIVGKVPSNIGAERPYSDSTFTEAAGKFSSGHTKTTDMPSAPVSSGNEAGSSAKIHFNPMALLFQTLVKLALFCIVQDLYSRPGFPQIVVDLLLTVGLFLFVTILTEVSSAVLMAWHGVHIKTHFNQPYIAKSFSSFWAKRWNLTVSYCFRESIYEPTVLSLLSPFQATNTPLPKEKVQSARFWGLLVTFFVSGIMHELAVYYLSSTVTGEMMLFFMIHGGLVALENIAGFGRVNLGSWRQRVLVVSTTFLLAHMFFFPPLHRTGVSRRVVHQVHSWFN